MKILFDNRIYKQQNFGGISRYFAELIKGIKTTAGFEAIPEFYYSKNIHLRDANLTHWNKLSDASPFTGKGHIENLIKKNEEKKIINFIRGNNFQVFHPTYYDTYFLDYLDTSIPFVLTIHDMIHELYYDPLLEQVGTLTINKKTLIAKATHIVAVSQNTKNDILRFYPETDKDKITVIYHGSSITNPIENNELYLPPSYFLYVGNRQYYKNFLWFMESSSDFLRERNITLVCAGGGDFTEFEKNKIINAKLSGHIKYIPIKDDHQLAWLYKNALCLVFPSLLEGFGIPILEAFACECPVLLSNASCFPEIGGDAALYFEIGNRESLIEQMEKMRTDTELVRHLQCAGKERLKMFNWQNMVQKHLMIYKSIAK